ncbi:hypothetical protein ES703_88861 [subsurface metagenome]
MTKIFIADNQIYNSGTQTAFHAAIQLDSSPNADILDNQIYGANVANTRGIRDVGSPSAIVGNRIENFPTILNNIAATVVIRHNIGYVTENSGTATMLNGGAAIVVAHGLAATPTVINVTGQDTEVSNIYVDTVGAANFTINRDGAEGNVTADKAIYWEAKVR